METRDFVQWCDKYPSTSIVQSPIKTTRGQSPIFISVNALILPAIVLRSYLKAVSDHISIHSPTTPLFILQPYQCLLSDHTGGQFSIIPAVFLPRLFPVYSCEGLLLVNRIVHSAPNSAMSFSSPSKQWARDWGCQTRRRLEWCWTREVNWSLYPTSLCEVSHASSFKMLFTYLTWV